MIVLKLIYWHFCWSIGPYLTTFMLKIWSNYIFFSFSCLLKTTVCRLSNVILKDRDLVTPSVLHVKKMLLYFPDTVDPKIHLVCTTNCTQQSSNYSTVRYSIWLRIVRNLNSPTWNPDTVCDWGSLWLNRLVSQWLHQSEIITTWLDTVFRCTPTSVARSKISSAQKVAAKIAIFPPHCLVFVKLWSISESRTNCTYLVDSRVHKAGGPKIYFAQNLFQIILATFIVLLGEGGG